MKIFIAAGHGGHDSGATVNGTEERAEAIKVVDKVYDLVKPLLIGSDDLIKVPHSFPLKETVTFINKKAGDGKLTRCIEVHLNSNKGEAGTGTEIYHGHYAMASILHKKIIGKLGLRDRGLKPGNHFYFNKHTTPGSAIIELGFINNPGDLARVRAEGAQAIAEGICAYLGKAYETKLRKSNEAAAGGNERLTPAEKLDYIKVRVEGILWIINER